MSNEPTGYKTGEGMALPLDRVRLVDGSEATVNSAAYYDYGTPMRQKFTICGPGPYPGPMFYADESELLHRCSYEPDPVTKIRRCVCGSMPAPAYVFQPEP